MTNLLVFRPQAEREARVARTWYEDQKSGLGERFADAIDATLRRIASHPLTFSRVHGEMRRAVLREFPYAIYFRVHEEKIVIIAVMHGHRHPRRWQPRR